MFKNFNVFFNIQIHFKIIKHFPFYFQTHGLNLSQYRPYPGPLARAVTVHTGMEVEEREES